MLPAVVDLVFALFPFLRAVQFLVRPLFVHPELTIHSTQPTPTALLRPQMARPAH
jgi:hypothetical protein